MSVMYIQGGAPLEGAWRVQGAKNSVLPVLAGCLLSPQPVVIRNCPRLSDVDAAVDILQHLGASCRWEGEELVVDAGQASGTAIDEGRMRAMRSSIMFLGPLAARMGEATLTYPGGCELGPRPIDLHLEALRAMGCQVEEQDGTITCRGRPRGGVVTLRFPSVGATENAMLCGAGAAEDTTIVNAAREPEIVQLQQFLNALGGEVTGAGGSVITVRGGRPLHGGAISILGDRIVAATLLSGVAAAGGEVELQGVDWRHLSTVLQLFEQGGGLGRDYSAARHDYRPPARRYRLCHGRHLFFAHGQGLIVRRFRRRIFALVGLYVFEYIDEHRPLSAAARKVKCLAHGVGKVLYVLYYKVVFGYRHGYAADVYLLEGVPA